MGDVKYTPGPWRVGRHSTGHFTEQTLLEFADGSGVWLGAISDEDARLIAAAPDLVEALRNLVGLAKMRGGNLHEYGAAIKDADAALSKAGV